MGQAGSFAINSFMLHTTLEIEMLFLKVSRGNITLSLLKNKKEKKKNKFVI